MEDGGEDGGAGGGVQPQGRPINEADVVRLCVEADVRADDASYCAALLSQRFGTWTSMIDALRRCGGAALPPGLSDAVSTALLVHGPSDDAMDGTLLRLAAPNAQGEIERVRECRRSSPYAAGEAPEVFISKRTEDTGDLPAILFHALTFLGIRPFFDAPSVRAGQQISEVVVHALSSSTAMVAMLSINLDGSHWCKMELLSAIDRGVPIVPVLVGGVGAASFPRVLNPAASVKAPDASQFDDAALVTLLRRVWRACGRPGELSAARARGACIFANSVVHPPVSDRGVKLAGPDFISLAGPGAERTEAGGRVLFPDAVSPPVVAHTLDLMNSRPDWRGAVRAVTPLHAPDMRRVDGAGAPGSPLARVFISHSHAAAALFGNQPRALMLALEALGVSTFIDFSGLTPGAHFAPQLIHALRGSHVLVAFVHPPSVGLWMKCEILSAVAWEKEVVTVSTVPAGLLPPLLSGGSGCVAVHSRDPVVDGTASSEAIRHVLHALGMPDPGSAARRAALLTAFGTLSGVAPVDAPRARVGFDGRSVDSTPENLFGPVVDLRAVAGGFVAGIRPPVAPLPRSQLFDAVCAWQENSESLEGPLLFHALRSLGLRVAAAPGRDSEGIVDGDDFRAAFQSAPVVVVTVSRNQRGDEGDMAFRRIVRAAVLGDKRIIPLFKGVRIEDVPRALRAWRGEVLPPLDDRLRPLEAGSNDELVAKLSDIVSSTWKATRPDAAALHRVRVHEVLGHAFRALAEPVPEPLLFTRWAFSAGYNRPMPFLVDPAFLELVDAIGSPPAPSVAASASDRSPGMPPVFVVSAGDQPELCARVVRALSSLSVGVHYVAEEAPAGDRVDDMATAAALCAATVVVAFLAHGEVHLSSKRQLRTALEWGKALLPVFVNVEPYDDVPSPLSAFTGVVVKTDIAHINHTENVLRAVLRAIALPVGDDAIARALSEA